jgi:hypothetical protein
LGGETGKNSRNSIFQRERRNNGTFLSLWQITIVWLVPSFFILEKNKRAATYDTPVKAEHGQK